MRGLCALLLLGSASAQTLTLDPAALFVSFGQPAVSFTLDCEPRTDEDLSVGPHRVHVSSDVLLIEPSPFGQGRFKAACFSDALAVFFDEGLPDAWQNPPTLTDDVTLYRRELSGGINWVFQLGGRSLEFPARPETGSYYFALGFSDLMLHWEERQLPLQSTAFQLPNVPKEGTYTLHAGELRLVVNPDDQFLLLER